MTSLSGVDIGQDLIKYFCPSSVLTLRVVLKCPFYFH